MKLISFSLDVIRGSKYILLLFFLVFPLFPTIAEVPKEIPGALKLLQERVNKIKSFDDVFEALDEFVNMKPQPGALYSDKTNVKKVLNKVEPVIVTNFSDLCDEAIYDFRQTLKVEFIKKIGIADGKMRQSEFIALVNSGEFPIKHGSDSYLSKHDKDHDGKLTIGEFVPSPVEIAKAIDTKKLAEAYINGEPYETGQLPTQKPFGKPIVKLYATTEMIERIIRMSSNMGDWILDPFLGAGTTSVVAKKLRRNSIGIDIDRTYCELSKKRLKKESNLN